MEELYANELLGLGKSLTELAVKGTATAISNKIKSIREEKNAEKLRATYDEIINELLNERRLLELRRHISLNWKRLLLVMRI